MAIHIWTVLCTRTIQDKKTNQVSLIDTIENVTYHEPEMPEPGTRIRVGHPVYLSVQACRSDFDIPETGYLRLKIVAPDGEAHHIIDIEASFESDPFQRFFLEFGEIPLYGVGLHWFNLEYSKDKKKWEKWSSSPMRVIHSARNTL